MNWAGTHHGRLLASLYLIAFPAMIIGLVLLLGSQLTGRDLLTGLSLVLLIGGQLVITGLSLALRDAVPAGSVKAGRDPRGFIWNRLSLGRELPSAWRLVRG